MAAAAAAWGLLLGLGCAATSARGLTSIEDLSPRSPLAALHQSENEAHLASAERRLRKARQRLEAGRAPRPAEDGPRSSAGHERVALLQVSGQSRGGWEPEADRPRASPGFVVSRQGRSDAGVFEADEAAAIGEMAERAALLQQLSESQEEGQATKARAKRLEALVVKGQRGWKADRSHLMLLQQQSATELAEEAQRLNASQARARRLERLLGQERAEAERASQATRKLLADGQVRLHEAASRLQRATDHNAVLEEELRRQVRATEESKAREAEEARRLSAASSELLRVKELLGSMQLTQQPAAAAGAAPRVRAGLPRAQGPRAKPDAAWEDAA